MRKFYYRFFVLFSMLTIATLSNAQLTNGIAINTSGNSNYTGAILDLSNKNTTGSTGFLPPYVALTSATTLSPVAGTAGQLSGLIVYNTSISNSSGLHGPGLYYWNNTLSPPSWVALDSLSNSGTLTGANNGLSISGTTLQLGGSNLIQATDIPLNGNTFSILGSSDTTVFTGTGQVGVGNTAPNSKAIVDFTNATNLGVMLPAMTTANLPPITAAQNGLVVFNTTIGCPEIAYNGSWSWFGFSHGTLTDTSFGIMTWTVPPCVTSITIVATGASGGFGGQGAIVTYNSCPVVTGEVIGMSAGEEGFMEYMGGGGGGGSFVWNTASTNTPLVAAGGGGGFGSGAGYDASITITPNGNITTNGAEGTGGGGGTHGSGVAGGGGGAGWTTSVASPVASTNQLGAGGLGFPGGFQGGDANKNCIKQSGQGGFGGGGGEGASTNASNWGGGGGGGGYNGGGGGNGTNGSAGEYGGAGGGSCINGATPSVPNTAVIGNTGNGSVIITW